MPASLGVTAVESPPVQESQNDSSDNAPNSTVAKWLTAEYSELEGRPTARCKFEFESLRALLP